MRQKISRNDAFHIIAQARESACDATTLQKQYDPELDDVGSVLRDVCECLESLGARFVIRFCSNDLWPATVRTDLLVVLE